jgi:glycine/D-amino acid oxidase-like deaminating enzyme
VPDRAVVVGCGIVGTCTALELARAGFSATVVDRLAGPARGSTRRSSSVIRCHYGEPETVKIAAEGRAIWADWPGYLGLRRTRARFVPCGVLFIHPEGRSRGEGSALGLKPEASGGDLEGKAARMRALGVRCALLRGRSLREAFPFLAFAEKGEVGLLEPDSGYVADARSATLDAVDACRSEGVRFRFGERVLAIETVGRDRRRVAAVRTARACLPADVVVNAAGPWSHELNLLARCPLPLSTVPLGQTVVEVSLAGRPEPRLPAMLDLRGGFYLRPSPGGVRLGAALARDHVDFRARAVERTPPSVLQAFARETVAALRRRWPAARVRSVRPRPALYDWTAADGYPLIDRTDLEGYFVAVGTSGAWFKGAPVIGRLVAGLASNPGLRRVRLSRTGNTLNLAIFSRRRSPIG